MTTTHVVTNSPGQPLPVTSTFLGNETSQNHKRVLILGGVAPPHWSSQEEQLPELAPPQNAIRTIIVTTMIIIPESHLYGTKGPEDPVVYPI